MPCTEVHGGPGMMGGDWDAMPCGGGYAAPGSENVLSLEDAQAAVERYILGDDGLHVTEVLREATPWGKGPKYIWITTTAPDLSWPNILKPELLASSPATPPS